MMADDSFKCPIGVVGIEVIGRRLPGNFELIAQEVDQIGHCRRLRIRCKHRKSETPARVQDADNDPA